MSDQSRTTIVFLAGMGTTLTARDASSVPGGRMPDFWDPGRLVPFIEQSSISARFLVFSYNGVVPNAARGFEPAPYSATDTRNQHLATYVKRLHHQLRAYAERHPSAEFHLVGHSEGGLIGFAYLAFLASSNRWRLPRDARTASVTTLDAPLGGIASANRLRMSVIRTYLALIHRSRDFRSFDDLLQIYRTNGRRYPLGGRGSVVQILEADPRRSRMTNQDVALSAHEHGVRVLTIGNARDYCFNPGHGFGPFVSTQWLSDAGPGSGIHGRLVELGNTYHALADVEINHGAVLCDPSVQLAIVSFILGGDPNPLRPAPQAESMAVWL